MFRHGKLTEVVLADFIASKYLNSASSTKTIEPADTSAFGTQDKTYITGMNDGTFSMSGLFDGTPDAIDEKFDSLTAIEGSYIATLFQDGGIHVGRACRSAEVRQTSYDMTSPVADVVSLSVELQSDRGLRGGVCLTENQPTAVLKTYATVDAGAFSATTRGSRSYVHVPANAQTGATAVLVQHSTNGTVWIDLATTSIPAGVTTSRVVETTGNVSRYVRAVITPAGTGNVNVIVAFARN